MKKRHQQKLVILSFLLLVLFNVPILFLFNSSESILGLPAIYAYIFIVWLGSSIASYFVFKKFDE